MTIETQENRATFIGDGAATVFPVRFPVAEPGHLRLYRLENNIESEIAGGYEVIGAGTRDVSVALGKPLPSGVKLTILRIVPYTQPMDILNGGDFNADILEGSADNIVMQIQQVAEEAGRAVKVPPSSDKAPTSEELLSEIKGWAEDARASALLAASLVDPVSIAAGFNIRKTWVASAAVAAGGVLTLPGYYYPGGKMLLLWYNGAVCSPRSALVEASGQYQYEETGGDLENPSNQVIVRFDVAAGDLLDMLVLASVKGDQGDSATVAIGTVTTLAAGQPATVENVGTETEAVLNFGIPKGAPGEGGGGGGSGISDAPADGAAYVRKDTGWAKPVISDIEGLGTALSGKVAAESGKGLSSNDFTDADKAKLDTAATPDSVAAQIKAAQHSVAVGTLSAALAAGANYTVPGYVVGSGKLKIFQDGLYCRVGSNNSFQYKEVGSAGAASTTIQFYDALPAGTELTAISEA